MNDLQELTTILEELNRAGTFQDAAERLVEWSRTFASCESAVLRLLQGDADPPWLAGCAMAGAPSAFARDETIIHGTECICGRVASGVTDPARPFYTPGGSFAWGRLSTLTTEFTPEEVGPLRGRCMEESFESLAVIPLRAGGQTVGSLHLADRRPDWFARLDVVEAVCRLAGDALLRYQTREREQAVLETIETALLPSVPPVVEGLEVGVSFASATEMAHVGGDFYDVLDLGETGTLVLVGDVSGKGIETVGTAARSRYLLETQARISPEPAKLMSAANDTLTNVLPPGRFVAVAACLIDPRSGALSVCLAGQPSPLLVTHSDLVELDAPHNPPLGLFTGTRFQAAAQSMADAGIAEDGLAEDGLLLFYTDGITDSRRGGHSFGMDEIADVVRTLADRDPQAVAHAVCAASRDFDDASRPADDRLVLAIRRTAASPAARAGL